MIDSTDARVHRAWRSSYCQGKSIINSINLEDGEERFERVVPLVRALRRGAGGRLHRRGQAAGQAVTRERKLAVAAALARPARPSKYGLRRGRPDLRPAGLPGAAPATRTTSAPRSRRSRASALSRQRFPRAKTILGISNVSFGLPAAGREVLNSVFLYHCTKAGLDLAIVNTEKLERYASIPEEERRLAEDLIYWRGDDPVAAFAAHFRERSRAAAKDSGGQLPLDERLARYIVEGSKDGLSTTSTRSSSDAEPLDIINGPLMTGMDEVGPALQRQRADRRRGAAERRGDEGRRRLPRAVHGEGRDRARAAPSCSPP